ncbi:hypothetical protein C8Q74DRAFT_460947 [Fomes fomentarius]|nr:hypothetical protein C8Q74DRAFT_460947 [Fomes fomentarius]
MAPCVEQPHRTARCRPNRLGCSIYCPRCMARIASPRKWPSLRLELRVLSSPRLCPGCQSPTISFRSLGCLRSSALRSQIRLESH